MVSSESLRPLILYLLSYSVLSSRGERNNNRFAHPIICQLRLFLTLLKTQPGILHQLKRPSKRGAERVSLSTETGGSKTISIKSPLLN